MSDEMLDEAMEGIQVPARSGSARTMQCGDGPLIMRMGVFPTTERDNAVLAHEIFHIVEILFVRLRMPHHFDYSSEAYAYLIQYVHEQIWTQLKRLH